MGCCALLWPATRRPHTHLSELLREREGVEFGPNHAAAHSDECRLKNPYLGRIATAPCPPAADALRGHAAPFALLLGAADATGIVANAMDTM